MIVLFLVTGIAAGGATLAVRQSKSVSAVVAPRKVGMNATRLLSQCRQFYKDTKTDYVLVSFTDYECPACRQTDKGVEQYVKQNEKRLNYAVLNYPLPQHKQAKDRAIYATARGLQGEFWQSHFELMRTGDPEGIRDWQEANPKSSLQRTKAAEQVADDMELAKMLRVSGTPTYFLCSKSGDVYRIYSFKQADFIMDRGW